MVYNFYIKGLKPFSINDAHYGQKSGYSKKPKTRYWERKLRNGFMPYLESIKEIKQTFIPSEYTLTRQYIFFYPRSNFFTKKKELSIFTKDVSNISKIPDDEIFNRVLGIDDKFIQRGSVEELPWDRPNHGCLVVVSLQKHEILEERATEWIKYLDAC